MPKGYRQPLTAGRVRLWCATGHDHEMALEQAERLKSERCCWCAWPMTVAEHGALYYWQSKIDLPEVTA